jgi:hypothetical protein
LFGWLARRYSLPILLLRTVTIERLIHLRLIDCPPQRQFLRGQTNALLPQPNLLLRDLLIERLPLGICRHLRLTVSRFLRHLLLTQGELLLLLSSLQSQAKTLTVERSGSSGNQPIRQGSHDMPFCYPGMFIAGRSS